MFLKIIKALDMVRLCSAIFSFLGGYQDSKGLLVADSCFKFAPYNYVVVNAPSVTWLTYVRTMYLHFIVILVQE